MDRLLFIQAIRGFSALSVVFFHSLILLSANDRNSLTGFFYFFSGGDIGVDLFFIVSGFVMVLVVGPLEEMYKGSTSWLTNFVARRMWRVMVPYILFTVLAYVGLQVLFPSKLAGQASLFESLLLIPSDRPFVLMVGWSLVYEFYFYIFFGFSCFFLGRQGRSLTGIVCVVLAFLVPIILGRATLFGNYDLTLLMYFAIGILFGVYRNLIEKFFLMAAKKFGGNGSFLFAFVCLAFSLLWSVKLLSLPGYRLLDYGPTAVSLFLFFWVLGVLYNAKSWFGLVSVGEWSYSLYLTHWLILNALVIIFSKLNLKSQPIHLIFSSVLCLFVGYLAWRFVENPAVSVGKKFFN